MELYAAKIWNYNPGMFKNHLRQLRAARGLSAEQLAELANTTAAQITRLETGERKLTFDWVERLARALQCSPLDIILSPQDMEEALIDRALLIRAVTIIDNEVINKGIPLSTENKAKAYAILYEKGKLKKITEEEMKIETGEIIHILRD